LAIAERRSLQWGQRHVEATFRDATGNCSNRRRRNYGFLVMILCLQLRTAASKSEGQNAILMHSCAIRGADDANSQIPGYFSIDNGRVRLNKIYLESTNHLPFN
jgi:hypothetical protein